MTRKLLCISLLLFSFLSFAQDKIQFDRMENVRGLENRSITSILQDDLGFMWFGTPDGLIRYDGYEIKIYKSNLKDKTSLADNNIRALAKDSTGNIWIATQGGGLDMFNVRTEKFIHYVNDPADQNSISGNAVWSLLIDSRGMIWAGTFSNGLNRFDPSTNKFTRIPEPSHMPVLAISEDKDGNIWFSANGVTRVDPDNLSIKAFPPNSGVAESLSLGGIRALLHDRNGKFRVGAENAGLFEFDAAAETFIPHSPQNPFFNSVYSLHEDIAGKLWVATNSGVAVILNDEVNFLQHDASDKHSLSINSIRSIYSDRDGNVWIGTEGSGVNKVLIQKKFMTFRHSEKPGSISHNLIRSIYEDSKERIWVGTQGGGLNILNPSTSQFETFQIPAKEVSSVFEDNDGSYWIGSWGMGLYHYDEDTKTLKNFRHSTDEINSLPDDRIQIVHRDKQGILWVATENGLSQFNESLNQWKHFTADNFPMPLRGSNVQGQAFIETDNGEIWLGTWFGLNRIGTDRQNVSYITADTSASSPLSSEHVISLCLDNNKEVMWIGTFGGGLNRVNLTDLSVTHYTEEDGLPNNTIYGIRQDKEGNLWLSTNNGLSRFNPTSKIFRNYSASEGLQGNEFYWGAAYKTRNGKMLFGGINGLNMFDPAEIKDNATVPPVVITALEIFNKSVQVGETSVLKENISITKELVLRYDQNVISFQYSALNYNSPEKNQYAYMLENFDNEWNYVGNKRSVSYTNLNPGEYVLRIRGSNNDGVWNEEGVAMKITIIPPFWKTWWFYSMVAVAAISLVYLIIRIRLRHLREEKEKLRITLQDALDKSNRDLELQKEAIAEEQKKNFERNWVDQSLSTISEILSKSKDDVGKLCSEILSALVRRCEVSAGAVYIFDEQLDELTRQANCGFAGARKSVAKGAGQIGECFDKQETMLITHLPEEYFKIASGLGSASPNCLLLVPLQYEEICTGVIELASFEQIPQYRIEFIEKLSAQMAAAIHTTQTAQRTSRLFEESKIQAEEMKIREEELKQNLEEMQAIQEDFNRKRAEYEKTIQDLRSRLKIHQ